MPNIYLPIRISSSDFFSKTVPVLKVVKWCIYFQILSFYSVQSVFIFPLRLSPQYYIPGLVDPPPSEPYSIKNAIKFEHSSKSAQEIANEFLRRFSKVSRPRSRSRKFQLRKGKPQKPVKSKSPSPNNSVTRRTDIDFALPLNYEIRNPSKSNQRADLKTPNQERVEEKLVLIVFKLPVKQVKENQNQSQDQPKKREKRHRPSLQFYERYDSESFEEEEEFVPVPMPTETSPARTLSLGKKIRSWWEGGSKGPRPTPTSAYPKFRPTRSNRPFSYSVRPNRFSERPKTYRPTTARSTNLFFGNFLKGSGSSSSSSNSISSSTKQPMRPQMTKPSKSPTPTTKSPHLSFSGYTFNGPGCHPRGPKLILCSTDKIEQLSILLEKFMHYQEKNNFNPYFMDTDEDISRSGSFEDYDSYQPSSYRHTYRYPKIHGRSRKPIGNIGITSGGLSGSGSPHPSVVVLAMDDQDGDFHEEEDHSHSQEHHKKENEDHKNGSGESKDQVVMILKSPTTESTKLPRSKREKRKLRRRRVRGRSEEDSSSSSDEDHFGGSSPRHREDAFRDRYLANKRKIEDEKDAEYKRLKRLMKLIKRYQELM